MGKKLLMGMIFFAAGFLAGLETLLIIVSYNNGENFSKKIYAILAESVSAEKIERIKNSIRISEMEVIYLEDGTIIWCTNKKDALGLTTNACAQDAAHIILNYFAPEEIPPGASSAELEVTPRYIPSLAFNGRE